MDKLEKNPNDTEPDAPWMNPHQDRIESRFAAVWPGNLLPDYLTDIA